MVEIARRRFTRYPTGEARHGAGPPTTEITMQMADLKVENKILPLNSMKVTFTKDPKSCKSRAEAIRNTKISLPDTGAYDVSTRFWESFCALHNIGMNVFDYWEHSEVFDRITQRRGNMVRISIEQEDGKTEEHGLLLTCTNPSKPILKVGEVKDLVDRYEGTRHTYSTGIIQVSFASPFPLKFDVAGDEFTTRFTMQMPVDGYGLPSAYLELMRTKSAGSIVGLSKAFKTQFQLGKDDNSLYPVLDRAMRTFNNEEGYHSFKQRLESAAKSWASFHEAGVLHALLSTLLTQDGMALPAKLDILKKYNELTGNPLAYYGVTGSNELSQRKAKTIPVNATIYDLINFATEIYTHYLVQRDTQTKLSAWIGDKITDEYDLEGSVKECPEFKDFFLDRTQEIIDPTGGRLLHLDDGPVADTPVKDAQTTDDSIVTDPITGQVIDPTQAVAEVETDTSDPNGPPPSTDPQQQQPPAP